jgi:hypothetical protein
VFGGMAEPVRKPRRHRAPKTNYACPYCYMNFSLKASYVRHMADEEQVAIRCGFKMRFDTQENDFEIELKRQEQMRQCMAAFPDTWHIEQEPDEPLTVSVTCSARALDELFTERLGYLVRRKRRFSVVIHPNRSGAPSAYLRHPVLSLYFRSPEATFSLLHGEEDVLLTWFNRHFDAATHSLKPMYIGAYLIYTLHGRLQGKTLDAFVQGPRVPTHPLRPRL